MDAGPTEERIEDAPYELTWVERSELDDEQVQAYLNDRLYEDDHLEQWLWEQRVDSSLEVVRRS